MYTVTPDKLTIYRKNKYTKRTYVVAIQYPLCPNDQGNINITPAVYHVYWLIFMNLQRFQIFVSWCDCSFSPQTWKCERTLKLTEPHLCFHWFKYLGLRYTCFTSNIADADGSSVSTRVCNLEVPDSNPDRAGYLSSWFCVYSAPNCSQAWRVQCCLWYCAL